MRRYGYRVPHRLSRGFFCVIPHRAGTHPKDGSGIKGSYDLLCNTPAIKCRAIAHKSHNAPRPSYLKRGVAKNTAGTYPSYLNLLYSGELEKRVEEAKKYLSPCTVCPRNCLANRPGGQKGICRAGRDLKISSYNLHYGEEPPISGTRGSGTIFFTGCSLKCRFCQNYPISQLNHGNDYSVEQLADMMIELQSLGAHNINLVTPTHFVPHIIGAVFVAAQKGLNIPLVYNTGGYDSITMLRLLDGIIDIYLPDIKYASGEFAFEYSTVKDYVTVNRQALREMHRQVGGLVMDEDGIALSGMIVRHLILPEDRAQTCESMTFIAEQLSPDTYVSLMNQYFPANNAYKFRKLSRRITNTEYRNAVGCLGKNGLENGWIQE